MENEGGRLAGANRSRSRFWCVSSRVSLVYVWLALRLVGPLCAALKQEPPSLRWEALVEQLLGMRAREGELFRIKDDLRGPWRGKLRLGLLQALLLFLEEHLLIADLDVGIVKKPLDSGLAADNLGSHFGDAIGGDSLAPIDSVHRPSRECIFELRSLSTFAPLAIPDAVPPRTDQVCDRAWIVLVLPRHGIAKNRVQTKGSGSEAHARRRKMALGEDEGHIRLNSVPTIDCLDYDDLHVRPEVFGGFRLAPIAVETAKMALVARGIGRHSVWPLLFVAWAECPLTG